ncbi:hypothetical protein EXE43_19560 [Halorubrum sp. SS5]|nr:hypothetical protein EXE43_19560 [Halorubrum sp. SS5]
MIESLTNPAILLGALAGGAFGAALGALPAFIFTGFLVIGGSLGGGGFGVDVGFGPVFGPHISFAGGVAAAGYAANKGYMESGFDYHNAKDIGFALGSKPDVLAVGAVFGIFGVLIEQLSRQLALPVDPIPVSIVISALVVRAVFGYSIVGKVSDKANGYFDMGPFEREEMREPGEVKGDGGKASEDRLAVEPWLPNMYKWSHVAAIGFFTGLGAGVITYNMISGGHGLIAVFAGFGISAASLLFLNLGVDRIPVTHHMTLAGATAFLSTWQEGILMLTDLSAGDLTAPLAFGAAPALLFGALFGLFSAVVGEASQRVFYAHSDTHFDPPAAAIVVWTLTIGLLVIAGLLNWGVWIPGTGI